MQRKALFFVHLVLWSDHGISALRDSLSGERDFLEHDNEEDDHDADTDAIESDVPEVASTWASSSFLETKAVSALESDARRSVSEGMATLQSSTARLARLVSTEMNEVLDLLEKSEEVTSEYSKTPEDQKIVQKSLKVSEQMVNLLKEIKASDNAIQQNLRKTGDPLVYDDGSITVEETTDPGKQVGELAVGLGKLAKKRGDAKMLQRTEGAVLEHMFAVQKLVDGAEETDEMAGNGSSVREALDDTEDNGALVEEISVVAARGEDLEEPIVAEMAAWTAWMSWMSASLESSSAWGRNPGKSAW